MAAWFWQWRVQTFFLNRYVVLQFVSLGSTATSFKMLKRLLLVQMRWHLGSNCRCDKEISALIYLFIMKKKFWTRLLKYWFKNNKMTQFWRIFLSWSIGKKMPKMFWKLKVALLPGWPQLKLWKTRGINFEFGYPKCCQPQNYRTVFTLTTNTLRFLDGLVFVILRTLRTVGRFLSLKIITFDRNRLQFSAIYHLFASLFNVWPLGF